MQAVTSPMGTPLALASAATSSASAHVLKRNATPAASHRADAFAAAEYLMDYLKSRAPFWKREITDDGATWVAAKDEDEDALSRW